MGLFKKKSLPSPSAWVPRTELGAAAPVVWDLANSPGSTDQQVRAAISRWNAASDKPTNAVQMMSLMRDDAEAFDRPWVWLRDVMALAAASQDHEVVCAGLFWAFHWDNSLSPLMTSADLFDFSMNKGVPPALKADIAQIGQTSAELLPPERRIVGDESGVITAGMLLRLAQNWLN